MTVNNKFQVLLGLSLVSSSACTADHVMEELTSTSISAVNGGTARSHDGILEVDFAPGALAEDTEIRIETRRGLLSHSRLVTETYELGPDGLTFQGAVEVRIKANGHSSDLIVANFDSGLPVVVAGSIHDRAADLVRAPLEHFSSYGAITGYVPCANAQCGDVCVLNDPANPNSTGLVLPMVCDQQSNCVAPQAQICGGPRDAGTPADGGGLDGGIPHDASTPNRDGGTGNLYPEVEPNDTTQQAQFLPAHFGGTVTVHGAITPANDVDIFQVVIPFGSAATLHAMTYTQLGDPSVCVGADTVLGLLDATGQLIVENDDNGTPCSEITRELPGGTYYLAVRQFAGQTIASYYLDITLTLNAVQDGGVPGDGGLPPDSGAGGGTRDGGVASDGGSAMDGGLIGNDGGTASNFITEVEPNNTPALAQFTTTAPGSDLTIGAAITPAGDVDLFSFNTPPGTAATLNAYTYTQRFNPAVCVGADTVLTVYDGTFNVLATNDDANGTSCSEVTLLLTGGNSYFVEVRHFNATGVIPQYYLDVVWQ